MDKKPCNCREIKEFDDFINFHVLNDSYKNIFDGLNKASTYGAFNLEESHGLYQNLQHLKTSIKVMEKMQKIIMIAQQNAKTE